MWLIRNTPSTTTTTTTTTPTAITEKINHDDITSTTATPPNSGDKYANLTSNQIQLLKAEEGLSRLMDDDITGARKILLNEKDSPYALAGLGICDFLAAAVGMEDERLQASMDALAQAEKCAKKYKNSNYGEQPEAGQWWSQPGMEFEVLLADVAAAQSLLHILSESYVEYMRAIWKLNSAFKHFSTIYKAVFPNDIPANATVSSIIMDLNQRYEAGLLSHAVKQASIKDKESSSSSSGISKSALGRLRGVTLPNAVKVHSSSDLTGLGSKLGRKSARSSTAASNGSDASGNGNGTTSSLPVSAGSSIRTVSPPSEMMDSSTILTSPKNEIVTANMPQPLWVESPVTSFIVAGGAFGHAIFELVFALMPPKARKMVGWLGYGTGDRKKALKLLELTALTGIDVHGSFASLALVSYYSSILASSGWQNDRKHLVASCNAVVDRAIAKHPEGKLWLVNKAKLIRYEGDPQTAAKQLEEALQKQCGFRQAISTLRYELCWVQLALGRYEEASEGFLKMIDLNSWSHTTYYALAASCMHEIESRTPAQEKRMKEMYAKIPNGFGRKRLMGQIPSSELYLDKRIKFYRIKTDKWIAAGRLEKGAEWYESSAISIALELSLFWNEFQHYPRESVEALIKRLEVKQTASPALLETSEEVTLCFTILGACHISLKDYHAARKALSKAESNSTNLGEAYTYLHALVRLYGAILECQEAEYNTAKSDDKQFWRAKLAEAETKIDGIFTYANYDMQGRIEGRGQMLRVEINERRARLGIA